MALTCLDIITDAMNELGVLAVGKTPKAAESELGLRRLQAILDGITGFGVGQALSDVDVSDSADLVADSKVMLNVASAATLTFPAAPVNGQRIRIIDLGGNLSSYNITLDANGRLIEGAATATLSTNSIDRTWIYVDGNWARVSDLKLTDLIPLGDDEFFTLELANRLSSVFGAQFNPASLQRAANRIRARFSYPAVTPCDDGVRYLSEQSYRAGLSF